MFAIERDRDLCPLLRERFNGFSNVTVVEADAKTIQPRTLVGDGPFVLCGNIPYHLSAPLLGLALAHGDDVGLVVYLVQRELADRLAAKPGTRRCGALSVLLQQRFEVDIPLRVGRGAFTPAPRVDSALLRLRPHSAERVLKVDHETFDRVVHAAFSQRRKQLANSLRQLHAGAEQACRQAGIDPSRRAETLTLQEFVELTRRVEEILRTER